MPKLIKYMAYIALFVVSFIVFLYWGFPYDTLKDRIIGMVEKEMGGDYVVSVKELSPYWLTGVDISGLLISIPGEGKNEEALDIDRVKVRASLMSLLFGTPRVSFAMRIDKGEISGSARQSEEEVDVDIDLDNVDLKNFKLMSVYTGISFSSKIDGDIRLKVDRQRPVRSSGKISLDLGDLKLDASNLKVGGMDLPLSELVLTKRRGSVVDMEMDKGTLVVKGFKLAGGDLEIDLKGKVFLSNNWENYRFNLTGSFKASEKLEKELPFLFIVEKQKREDGSFPISITGRLVRPAVKIGNFTLPISG